MHVKKKNYILQGGGVGGKEIELCIGEKMGKIILQRG